MSALREESPLDLICKLLEELGRAGENVQAHDTLPTFQKMWPILEKMESNTIRQLNLKIACSQISKAIDFACVGGKIERTQLVHCVNVLRKISALSNAESAGDRAYCLMLSRWIGNGDDSDDRELTKLFNLYLTGNGSDEAFAWCNRTLTNPVAPPRPPNPASDPPQAETDVAVLNVPNLGLLLQENLLGKNPVLRLVESSATEVIVQSGLDAAVAIEKVQAPQTRHQGWRELKLPVSNAGFVNPLHLLLAGNPFATRIGENTIKSLVGDFKDQHDDELISAEKAMKTALVLKLDKTLCGLADEFDVLQWDIRFLGPSATGQLTRESVRYSIVAIARFNEYGLDSAAMLVCAGETPDEQVRAEAVIDKLKDGVRAYWLRTGLCIHLFFG